MMLSEWSKSGNSKLIIGRRNNIILLRIILTNFSKYQHYRMINGSNLNLKYFESKIIQDIITTRLTVKNVMW